MGASQLLLTQQLANELAGPLAIVCRYVEMGDRPDHERAKRGNQHSTLCCRCRDRRGGGRAGVDHDDVRLDTVRFDRSRDLSGNGISKDARGFMIIAEPLHMMIKGVQAGGGEHAGLAPATTEPFAQHPSSRDVLSGRYQTEPTGAPRPLEKHTLTVSKSCPYASRGTPVATWAFHNRAPSRW